MSAPSDSMQPTSRRAIPLSVRSDLRVRSMTFRGTTYWTIKDPVSLRYHRLREDQYYLLTQLDGARTLEQLQKVQQQRFPQVHWGLTSIQALISDLHEKRLLVSHRFGQSEGIDKQRRKTRKQKITGVLLNFLFLRLPGWYPEPFLRTVYPWVRWMFRPWFMVAVILAVTSALSLLTIHFDTFRRQLPEFQQFFAWPNLLYLWLTMAAIKVIHELGHGLTCHHFGAESHAIGLMLLVFSPTLYCDVSDAWMIPNKWKRILIASAGMIVEVFLSAIFLFIWWNTEPGLVHHLALNVFFVTTVTTVIFNANPLMRLDGYYILSDLLEIPNLKQRSDQLVMRSIGDWCFGIEPQRDPFEPERGKLWLALYALASSIYRWILMLGIGWFLYSVLKPYRLESLGVMMVVVSFGGMIGRFLYQVIKMVRAPRSKPLSRKRMLISALVLVLLLTGLAAIPIPIYVEAAVLIQPHNVRHVHTQVPGTIDLLNVQPGDSVSAGENLLKLENPELQDQLRALESDLRVQEQRRDTAIALSDPTQKQLAENHLQSLRAQIDELRQQLARLTIDAPVAGTVIAPESVPEPTLEPEEDRLSLWYGHPLQKQNIGSFLEARTHVLSLAPDSLLEAVLYIDQTDRNELTEGSRIRLKFDHLPDRIFAGELTDLSAQPVAYVPSSLSNKSGGPLATVTEPDGRERLTSVAWQARVILDSETGLFLSGFRGRARLLVTRRSAGGWLWSWLRETIHFRL